MKVIYVSLLTVLSLASPLCIAQTAAKSPAQEPIETDICQILSKPYAYNSKIVKVPGYLSLNFEYSMLMDERCDALWLAFADGSVPPQLVATVNGKGTPGGRDSKGRRTPLTPVHLVRDSNWEQLEHYMTHNVNAESCLKGPAPDLDHLDDCFTYRITATFTGRIDAISKSVYESRLKRKNKEQIDWKGFGQMGLFDAQIVIKSVEDVVAIDESELRQSVSGSHR